MDRKKAPQAPAAGEVLRLRGLPWSAGPAEVAQFLQEFLGADGLVTGALQMDKKMVLQIKADSLQMVVCLQHLFKPYAGWIVET